jgi:hypothetical protein
MEAPPRLLEQAGGFDRTVEEFDMTNATCAVDNCSKPPRTRKMCDTHYARWRRNGDPGTAELRTIRFTADMTDKRCTGCGEVKPLDSFHRVSRAGQYVARCKACRNAEISIIQRKRRYGLSGEEYVAMLDRQNGSCAVCGSTKRLCVDHDHSTGAIRKILCDFCNKALGMVEDDAQRLRALADYIESHIS